MAAGRVSAEGAKGAGGRGGRGGGSGPAPSASEPRSGAQVTLVPARLLAIAAHDLRSPLGAIVGALDLLEEDADDDTKSLVAVLRRSTQALTRLASDLSALGGSRGEVVRAPTPLAEVVRAAVGRVRDLAAARGVTIVVDLAEVTAVVDGTLFGHLCDILLDDTITASGKSATITLTLRQDAASVELVVVGEGPPPDDAKAYFSAPRARARGGRGSGIAPVAAGLLAQLLDGTLTVEPAGPTGGARFLFHLASA